MRCLRARRRLSAYLDGELDERGRAAVEAHLPDCPACAARLARMQASWEARDFEELAGLAHWLKGSGGTVGFDEFFEPAAALELLAKEGKEGEIEESISELRRLADRIAVESPDDS